jgi:hypothetical protein
LGDEHNTFELGTRRASVELPGMMAVGVRLLIDEVLIKAVVAFLKKLGCFLIVTNENSTQVNDCCY